MAFVRTSIRRERIGDNGVIFECCFASGGTDGEPHSGECSEGGVVY